MRVPAANRLGGPGEGFKVAMATLDIFRSTVGAAALGFARRALHETVEHAASRKLFGAPLGDLQMTQAAIADSATEVDAAALLVYRAAWTKDQGAARVTSEAAMAKMFATEAAQRVIDRAVQLHGGLGVTKGVKVEELYREIRALRIYEGATEVQKIVIAREALKNRQGKACAGSGIGTAMTTTGHIDTFARDNLPPRAQWPEFRFDLPELRYGDRLNCVTKFLDRWVAAGEGGRPCLISPSETLSYAQLSERVNRIANVLTRDLGLIAWQSRAAALRQQSDDGRRLSGRAESRRGGGGDHAAASRQGAELSDRQGQDRAGTVRRAACRRDGEGQGGRARSQAHRLLG